MNRLLACVGVVLVAAFGATACGDDDESQSAAEADVCTNLKAVESAMDQVEGVQLGDPEANAQNLSVKRVAATWSGVEQAARDLSEADADAVGSSVEELEAAVDDLPTGLTAAEAKAELKPQIDAVRGAVQEMRDGIECTP